MAIRYVTGRVGALEGQLLADVAERMRRDESTLYIVVPKHLTLEMELKLIGELKLTGSFRLQVLSFERLCHRIFECAGQPERTLVDDQGRVMLMMRALSALDGELSLYGGAQHRPGFAQKCVEQLESFRQSELTPEMLAEQAARAEDGVYARKLSDLSVLLAAYQAALGDRFADGVVQYEEACARMADAPFVRESAFYLYGFDMLPPALHRLIARLAQLSGGVHLYLPLENDGDARDFDSFLPMQHSFERLQKRILQDGTPFSRVRLAAPETGAPEDLALVQRELFAYPAQKFAGEARHVALGSMTSPMDEALYAAALTRKLVRENGWHYGDVAFFAPDVTAYESALAEACRLYGVPVFLAESRPANRHPMVRCLTSTLQWIDSGYRTEDAPALLGCGMFPLTGDEADRFANFCIQQGVRGYQLKRPLRGRKDLDVSEMEPLRARWMQPILDLEERMKRAEALPAQLTAIFDFLTDIDAYNRCLEQQQRLIALDQRQSAAEDAQVWNRLLATLDQMHLLLGAQKRELRELAELLDQALGASIIKTLPQSGDAVSAQSLSRTAWRPAKLSIFMGLCDRTGSGLHALLTEQELARMSRDADVWMGLSGVDQARVNRYYLKNAVEQTRCHAVFTCPVSDADERAQRMGAAMAAVRKLFDHPLYVGGLIPSDAEVAMRYGAPDAARLILAERIGDEQLPDPLAGEASAALWALSRQDGAAQLRQLAASASHGVKSEAVPRDVARRMYGPLGRASISRLETYARCPFQHFVAYGLRPEPVEPLELSAQDEGDFYHEAVRRYLSEAIASPDAGEAEGLERMDRLTDALVADMFPEERYGESAVHRSHTRQLRYTARSAAKALSRQLVESHFAPTLLEVRFGDEEPRVVLHPEGGDTVLDGRIDRIDEWKEPGVHCLRVIDYKRGSRDLDLAEVYFALQLQLIIYLAAAMKKTGGRSAGAYYFRVSDPVLATDETDPAAVEALRDEKMRLRGLLPADEALIRAMAAEPEKVFAVRLNRDGSLRKGALQLDDDQLQLLIDSALGEATRILSEIRRGETAIRPARLGLTDGCAYCRYHALCQRDAKIPGGDARRYPRLKPDEVLERLQSEAPAPESEQFVRGFTKNTQKPDD